MAGIHFIEGGSMVKMHLFLSLAACVALSGVARADDASASAATPSAAATDASPTADAASNSPVAKNDAPGSLAAGKQLLNDGKFAEAAAYFEGIGEQVAANGATKREPYRLLDLSTAYLGLGKYSDAEDAASKATDADKDLAAAWNNLAAAQVNQGERDKAIDTYTKAIAQLQADKVDTTKLEANLAVLQAEADKKNGKKKAADAGGDTSAAASATPSAAASSTSPAASGN
jgi:tetratricopeptide (TPR) repeat protein